MEDSSRKYLEDCLKDFEKKDLMFSKGIKKRIIPSASKLIYLLVDDYIQNGLKLNLSISTIYLNCCQNIYFKKYITYPSFYAKLKHIKNG